MRIKTTIIIVIFLLTTISKTKAQASNREQEQVANAIALVDGSFGKFNRPKAYETLRRLATQGNARAMNALGLMNICGYVGTPDTLQAVEWLTTAGNSGFLSAWVNIGYIYKYARGGVKQDLAKAFLYFNKAAQAGAINGLYETGYMLYKGIGCEQNYEKAFSYLNNSASHNYSPAMYMLGLCYRNGYGTTQNDSEAHYWLSAADKLGYRFATEELEKETAENQSKPNKVKRLNAEQVPLQFRKIAHLNNGGDIVGTYEGILVTYDWSGKNILKETPLTLSLTTQNGKIVGTWIENGTDTAHVFAERNTDGLRFTETQHYRADHYTVDTPTLFNFEKAEIQVNEDVNGTLLIGNIQMYSPETMEPERPMYISLRHVTENKKQDNSTGKTKQLTAYPVPFTKQLNICFTQTKDEADVTLGIYNTAGECVYFYDAGRVQEGEQRFTLTPSLISGTYVLRLTAGKHSEQTVIICKGRTKQ